MELERYRNGFTKYNTYWGYIYDIRKSSRIVEYTETMIRINTRSGELVISGENLKIKVCINEAIIINGRISGIKI